MDSSKIKNLRELGVGKTILYVEDEDDIRKSFLNILNTLFENIIVATNGDEGLSKYIEFKDKIDLIITDINMPKLNGIEMAKKIKELKPNQSLIFVTAYSSDNYLIEAIRLNIDGYIIKPVEIYQTVEVLHKTIKKIHEKKELDSYREHLEVLVDEKTKEVTNLNFEIDKTLREVVFTLSEIAEAKSKETGNHVKRVANFSRILGEAFGMSQDELKILKNAAAMHDIGKIAIPDSILNKPSSLTDSEFEMIKNHTVYGYDILRTSERDLFQAAAIVAHQHHEKYDGRGYPRGVRGESIHIYGRITAIADVFDALASDRVYKRAWEVDRVLELLKSESGKHFDPHLIELFFKNLDEILQVQNDFKDVK